MSAPLDSSDWTATPQGSPLPLLPPNVFWIVPYVNPTTMTPPMHLYMLWHWQISRPLNRELA